MLALVFRRSEPSSAEAEICPAREIRMLSFAARSRFALRLFWAFSFCMGAMLLRAGAHEEWPGPEPVVAGEEPADHKLIKAQRVCVLNTLDSAGDIGQKIAFRSRRDGDELRVSYFVNWSTERPWGDRSPIEALAIDSVYSHFFFFLPGLRYLMHGPSDIEGATVVYRVEDERLSVVEGFADDDSHKPVTLRAEDLRDGDGTALMTSVWSHQLGTRGAARAAAEAPPGALSRRCYQGADLIPLTPGLAERFWLGTADAPRRARPAWR
jgi:hypothetical protein